MCMHVTIPVLNSSNIPKIKYTLGWFPRLKVINIPNNDVIFVYITKLYEMKYYVLLFLDLHKALKINTFYKFQSIFVTRA